MVPQSSVDEIALALKFDNLRILDESLPQYSDDPQLYAPRVRVDYVDKRKRPALVPGRNSCREIGNRERGDTIYYKVQGFSYPVPACGARHRVMYVSDVNA